MLTVLYSTDMTVYGGITIVTADPCCYCGSYRFSWLLVARDLLARHLLARHLLALGHIGERLLALTQTFVQSGSVGWMVAPTV